MLTIENYNEYFDLVEEHQDFITLMEQYFGTELYQEIIGFMYEAFPGWTTNSGLGSWAAEFVLTAIHNLEDIYNDSHQNSKEKLADVYVSLAKDYNQSRQNYQMCISDAILNKFNSTHQDTLLELENLPKDEFNAAFDALYETFEWKYLNEITYNFHE